MANAYNKAGLAVSQTYPSSKVIASEYDGAGRLAGVKQGASFYAGAAATDASNRLQYTAHGAVSVMKLGNSRWEHATFNSRLQPTQIGLGTTSSNSSLLQLDYGYGGTANNGNLRTQTVTAPGAAAWTQSYTYDAVNRLASVSEAGAGTPWSQTYSYDVYGNRWVSAYAGASLGLLTPRAQADLSASTNRLVMADFGYDAAGNVTADASNAAMVYDAENRLTTYTRYNKTTSYSYDGDGRRVKRLGADGVTTVFIYDASGMLVAEYDNAGPAQAVDGAGGTKYLTADHLGSVRVVTDSGGAVKSRHDYLPFGEEIDASFSNRAAVAGYGGSDATRQRFTSKERDGESGLDYFLARYYSGAQGRFTSPDEFTGGPVELYYFAETASGNPTFYADIYDPQTLNKYQYCLNNPLRYVDPDGHQQMADALSRAGQTAGSSPIPIIRLGGLALSGVAVFVRLFNDPKNPNVDADPSCRSCSLYMRALEKDRENLTRHEAKSQDSSSEGRTSGKDKIPDLSEEKEKQLLAPKDNRGKRPGKDRTLQGTQDQQEDLQKNRAKDLKAGKESIRSTGKTDQNARTARKRVKSSEDVKPDDKKPE